MNTPLAIYLVGGRVLIAPNRDGDSPSTLGARCELRDVYELQGALDIVPSRVERGAAEVRRTVQVRPISGLVTLTEMAVLPSAIVPLADLASPEARELEQAYEACHTMVGQLRAQMSGVAISQLVKP